ncbi:hypothetical protein DFH27DRAFT_513489 [Peziza echinospora]|nr:hypothetical protein DFH27DRAFT_513489 [Peziza echinospora]
MARIPLANADIVGQDGEHSIAPLEYRCEPVAIIGMACRWPGSCNTPSALWDLLLTQKSAQCPIPMSRFKLDSFYHPEGQRPGSLNTEAGYFLKEDPREFDPSFFSISTLEATSMDPQQRKLLEVVYEALEAGGQKLDTLSGSRTGVFVGNFSWEHSMMVMKDPEYLPGYATTGYGVTILSNRVSYVFGLTGPSLTIDTACSSSLYALHIACIALEIGDCTAAVVGGVNLVLGPEGQMSSVKLGVLSPTSTCHSFDSMADGYARGEGVGAIYLKRLSDALRDGDPIRAVIRGTAVNSNGKTGGGGMSHPSVKAQEDVIRHAYKRAGLENHFNDTGYFECHGTGTAVGDPLEISAVGKVFAAGRSLEKPLLVGSIKSNLGHGEASSGLAGIMKAVLILEKGKIPATIGICKLNENINFQGGRIKVATETTPWPNYLLVRRISINSFGYGGANGHAILEALDRTSSVNKSLNKHTTVARNNDSKKRLYILPFSAHDNHTLKENIIRLTTIASSYDTAKLAHTLISRRTKFFFRGYLIAEDNCVPGGLEKVSFGEKIKGGEKGIVYVFTGQGAQWNGMGRWLFQGISEFARTIRQLDQVLNLLPKVEDRPNGWTLEDLLLGSSAVNIDEPLYAQSLCTALQIGIINTLRTWGINPSATIGHSSGEIAAAYAAGLLNQAEAIIIAYYRGYAIKNTVQPIEGMMAAVGLSVEEVERYFSAGNQIKNVGIACNNSPESVTLSGDKAAVELAIGNIKRDKPSIFVRALRTGGMAYHSVHMQQVGERYEACLRAALPLLQEAQPRAERATCPMFSTVEGSHDRDGRHGVGPGYWRRNLESQVAFGPAMERIIGQEGFRVFLEIGPHSVLSGPIRQVSKKVMESPRDLVYLSALVRNTDSVETLMAASGELWTRGFAVDLAAVNGLSVEDAETLVDLPAYSWNYGRLGLLWAESRLSSDFRFRKCPRHDLLGSRIPGTAGTWRNILRAGSPGGGWLDMHRLGTQAVFPAAGYLAMAAEALAQRGGGRARSVCFAGVSMPMALAIPKGGVEVVLTLTPKTLSGLASSYTSFEFAISSIATEETRSGEPKSRWVLHCSGTLGPGPPSPASTYESRIAQAPLHYASSSQRWYNTFSNCGLNYGQSFAQLSDIFTNPQAQQATGSLPLKPGHDGSIEESEYLLHPATIDMCLQMTIIAGHAGLTRNMTTGYVPIYFEKLTMWPKEMQKEKVYGKVRAHGERIGPKEKIIGHCELRDSDGNPLLEFESLQFTPYTTGLKSPKSQRNPYLRIVWKPDIRCLRISNRDLKLVIKALINCYYESVEFAPTLAYLGQVIDLLSHKKPTLKVLEIGGGHGVLTRFILDKMHHLEDQSFRRYGRYIFTDTTDEFFSELKGSFEGWPAVEFKCMDLGKDSWEEDTKFDLIIAVNLTSAQNLNILSRLQSVRNLLKVGDQVLNPSASVQNWSNALHLAGFSGTDILLENSTGPSVILTTATRLESTPQPIQLPDKHLIFVYRNEEIPISSKVSLFMKDAGFNVTHVSLLTAHYTHASIFKSGLVVVVAELEQLPLFTTMNDEEFKGIQYIIESSHSVLWLTEGSYITGGKPECGMMPGLARTIMAEQPALKLYTMDFSMGSFETNSDGIVKLIFEQILHMLSAHELPDDFDDYHLAEMNGIIHVSRIIPDPKANIEFTQSVNRDKDMARFDAMPMVMRMEQVGMLDSIYFMEDTNHYNSLAPGYVEVKVKAAGMNAKDIYIALGHFDSKDKGLGADFFNIECAGIVARVAPDVTSLKVGESVVCLGFGHYGSYCRVLANSCKQVSVDADFDEVATMPVVFCTALYAFKHLARLCRGQTVLIHSAAGGLGIAAIQIAQLLGAEVYATVSNAKKREHLKNNFGIPDSHIFYSRDGSFVGDVISTTRGKGVDVILTSAAGDIFYDSFDCVADNGIFIDVGRKETRDNGRLGMGVFKRGITFTSFDLNELGWSKPRVHQELLREVVDLYNNNKISPIFPITKYDISELGKAMRHFSTGTHIGKIVITYSNPNSLVRSLKNSVSLRFRPDSAYLLIGALGGLGRSLCQWMVSRGARNLVFISRSGAGAENSPANLLLQDLEASGVRVQLIRGDVTNPDDVQRTISLSEKLIRGVVMGAMVVEHGVFTGLKLDEFKRVIKPKIFGTLALHEAFKDIDLDFFVMMSSLAGSIGVPSEAAYCGANAVMDGIARHRYSQGLPVTSLALGMVTEVGYISERAEREQGLVRAGLYGIPEAEFLMAMELAMSNSKRPVLDGHVFAGDPCANSYFLMGMEPIRLKEMYKAGFTGIGYWKKDARFSVITNELQTYLEGGASITKQQTAMEKLRAAARAQQEGGGYGSLEVVKVLMERIFYEQLANLLLLGSVEQLDTGRTAAEYGMDSIIGAELRHWMHRELGVEMTHLELLSPVSVGELAGRVFERMASALKGLEK